MPRSLPSNTVIAALPNSARRSTGRPAEASDLRQPARLDEVNQHVPRLLRTPREPCRGSHSGRTHVPRVGLPVTVRCSRRALGGRFTCTPRPRIAARSAPEIGTPFTCPAAPAATPNVRGRRVWNHEVSGRGVLHDFARGETLPPSLERPPDE